MHVEEQVTGMPGTRTPLAYSVGSPDQVGQHDIHFQASTPMLQRISVGLSIVCTWQVACAEALPSQFCSTYLSDSS